MSDEIPEPKSGGMPTRSPRLSPIRSVTAMLAALVIVVAACAAGTGEESDRTQRSDFRLETLAGERLGPPDFSGKIVVADFWATWCAPCRIQAQVLESLRAEYEEDEIQFLAINVGEGRKKVARFVEDEPFAYPVLLDPEEEVGNRLGIVALPTVMVVDPQGHISYLESGIITEDRLREVIDKAGG